MKLHFTKNTVEAEAWCKKCERRTQHSVVGGKIAQCLVMQRDG